MNKIRKGDIVGRISYNKDIIFMVKDITNKKKVILQGIFERIIVDSDINDLVLINKEEFRKIEIIKDLEYIKKENRIEENTITGTILHLDAVSDIINEQIRT